MPVDSRVIIRRFVERDTDDYASTLLRTLPCESIEEARDDVNIVLGRVDGGEELWVAELDGHAVGFALLEFTRFWGDESEAFQEEGICIDWLDVHPNFQRLGVGKALLSKTEERAREKGLQRVFMHTFVDNDPMLRFSEKTGFRLTRRMKLRWKDGARDGFLMEKILA